MKFGWRRAVLVLALLGALAASEWGSTPRPLAAYVVAFSPDGSLVAAVGETKDRSSSCYWAWDVATGRPVASARLPGRPVSLAFRPDGSSAAVGCWDGRVHLLDPRSGRVESTFEGHSTPVRGVAFTPDGRTLATGASDGLILLRDARTGDVRSRIGRGRDRPVNSLAISWDGRYLAAAGGVGPLSTTLHDLATGATVARSALDGTGEPVAFAPGPGPPRLAVRSNAGRGSVAVVDVEVDRIEATLPAPGLRSVAFAPDGRALATAGDDGRTIVRRWPDGREVARIEGLGRSPGRSVGPVENWLISAGLARLESMNPVWTVAFSPDTARLASASEDGTVRMIDLPNPELPKSGGRTLLGAPTRPAWTLGARVVLGLALLVAAVGPWVLGRVRSRNLARRSLTPASSLPPR